MQSQSIDNYPPQDESLEYTWKSTARIFKLFFYILTIGVTVLSFASSMRYLDTVVRAIAGGSTLITATGIVSLRTMAFIMVMGNSKEQVAKLIN